MSSWYCRYIIRKEFGDNFIIVLFENGNCKTRVIFVDKASTDQTTFREVESGEVVIYRDGGSTYIPTTEGNICLPFGGEHVLASPEMDIDDRLYILESRENMMEWKNLDEWKWDPAFEYFDFTENDLGLPPHIPISIINDITSCKEAPWFISIKNFIGENGWRFDK